MLSVAFVSLFIFQSVCHCVYLFQCQLRQLMHCDTLKQDNDSTVRGDGGSWVGEVRAGTTSPMPEHKGFKLQLLSRDPLTPADGPGSVSVIYVLTAFKITLNFIKRSGVVKETSG